MKLNLYILLLSICPFLGISQNKFQFQNTNLSTQERVESLLSEMTVQEKMSQMLFTSPAIERLGVPEYNWWNECLHGVARAGYATVFPQSITIAASWDKDLLHEVASVISDEARAKHHHEFVRRGMRDIYQGLTFWSPNINIFRDPRWGRGHETYGEDPYLTGQLGTPIRKGASGRRSELSKSDCYCQTFCRSFRPRTIQTRFRCQSQRTRFTRNLPPGIPYPGC